MDSIDELDAPISIKGNNKQRLMTQAFINRKKMTATTLEPVRRFKKRDGSINDNFNLNLLKTKYKGLENFLEENYSKRNQ
jgi:hypothetical protein